MSPACSLARVCLLVQANNDTEHRLVAVEKAEGFRCHHGLSL